MKEVARLIRQPAQRGRKGKTYQDEEENEEEMVIWEVMRRKMKRKKEMEVQNSIFYATESTIREADLRERLVFHTPEKAQGYDIALSILARIRWGPGLVYKEEVYPDMSGIHINWKKIWWDKSDKTKEGKTGKEQSTHMEEIEIYSVPVQNTVYVIGTTTIKKKDATKQEHWCHILGSRFSDDPINQAGVNLTVSLTKVNDGIDRNSGGKSKNIRLKIYTDYGHDFTTDQKRRWRTYGATTKPIPGQKTLNEALAKLTNTIGIQEVILMKPSKNQKKEIEKAHKEQLENQRVEDILGPERKYMAGFWAAQEEVKKVLKEVNELDEQAVMKHLATGRGRNESQSCRMCLNWDLDRGKIRKILAHLAEDRTLQTTFANLVGATRFKAGEKGKL